MEAIALIVIFGLAWGSFLNVVIYRLPEGISLVRPRSFCRECKRQIPFYDNIPLLSYLILRGRCRRCGARISPSYLIVEILTPACFILLYALNGLGPGFVAACLFTSALIALGFIDFYHQVLPDAITLPVIGLAMVYSFFRPDLRPVQALIGAVVGGGFLLLIYGLYYLIRRKEGLGLGDVTMMTMIGAFLGWRLTILTLILASLVGALVGVFFIVRRRKNLQFALPFGTFLAPAAFMALLRGREILSWYLGLYRR
jgi:leader peptidase (prepilin peptidase)/N-methyltransferase